MRYWASVFFLFAVIAGFLGFNGEPSAVTGIWKILFFISLVLCAVSLLAGLRRRHRPLN